MEYVEGDTLEQELRTAGGKLPEERVIEIALQVLDTLEYLHHREPPVIYCDEALQYHDRAFGQG